MVPSSNTLDLLAGTRGWRSGTPIVLTCGLCRRRPWSPRRNRLSGRRGRHNLGGRPGSTRSGWPYGFRPGSKRHVSVLSPESHDETIRAAGWSIARAIWPSRTVASRHSDRIVPTSPVRISLLRSGCRNKGRHNRRCGDVGKRRIWSGGEDRCSSVARSGGPGCHRRSGARSTAVEYGRAARSRSRARQCPLRDRASSLL